MTIKFIIPCYNAAPNIDALFASLTQQNDPNWHAIFIDDLSTDDTLIALNRISNLDKARVSIVKNNEKKYALRNIVDVVFDNKLVSDEDIIAIIDGDDSLCNVNTTALLHEAYSTPNVDAAWTAHRWDVNDLNVSKAMPDKVNPYQYQWCSSHLKTFRSNVLRSISLENFKDAYGRWFKRGYDQALMLPVLFCSRVRLYIPEVCYMYNINSCSLPQRDWSEKMQLSTVNFVRARGFIK